MLPGRTTKQTKFNATEWNGNILTEMSLEKQVETIFFF